MCVAGRVCVPIDPENVDEFSPFEVPTISGIIDELGAATDSETDENKKTRGENIKVTLSFPI